jgi:hypothetical protein
LIAFFVSGSLRGKEIAVKIRGNSHYRNLRGGAISRNAYRSAAREMLLGKGELFCVVLYKKKGYKNKNENQNANKEIYGVLLGFGCSCAFYGL